MLQFTSFFLALLVLISSIGVNLNAHYCQGELVSYAFFNEAKSCYEIAGFDRPSKPVKTLPTPVNDTSVQKDNCCKDQHARFQLDQEQGQEGINLAYQQDISKALPVYNLRLSAIQKKPYTAIYFDAYKPPLLSRDLSVLHQSFLL